ncbi:Aldolase-type TIM barrel [Penicillium coprophilum]|uniref:Aldolase-type TIM barrel n=1 Tax=Penicillium coprophilum TaxID=36646 RepID=UPI00238B69BF|nr:Aldolase-type TIM barrel [Penicillium coprophilum]KAJ5150795.1 Aldolase-type TIM barrel [Penicillium coprophilum]
MATVNLLEYLHSRTQLDIDTYNAEGSSKEIGPFQDATGNQFEIQAEIVKPNRSALVKKSLALATTIHPQFASITLEELAVEVVGIEFALEMIQTVRGNVHVMVNPSYSYNTEAMVANAQPTWEGLQAARQLKRSGVKTLATTLFSMEQAILAGEAGCTSISPFVHELKTETYEGYKDSNPIFGVCMQAQQFYRQNSMPTRVKACVTLNLDEIIMLAGIDALTITPQVLKDLAATERPQEGGRDQYRIHFAASEGGKAQFKTAQAIALFCDAQTAVELYIKSQLEESSYIPINL